MKIKKVCVFIVALVLALGFSGCQRLENDDSEKKTDTNISLGTEVESESPLESEVGSEDMENAISKEKMEWFETVFFNDDQKHIVNMFLTSEYDTPEEINLGELFYDGIDSKPEVSEYEKELLKKQYDAMIELDVCKIPVEDMDTIINHYMGISLEQTQKKGLEMHYYLDAYKSYYRVAGDTGYIRCDIIKGWMNEDGTITLQYCDALSSIKDMYEVTLKAMGDSYQFVSNKKVDEK